MNNTLTNQELHILFLSHAYLKLYIEGTNPQATPKEVLALSQHLHTQCNKFPKKKFNKITKSAMEKFKTLEEKIKQELNLEKQKSKYSSRITLNQDGDIEVHGLLFALSLLMEHENLPVKNMITPDILVSKILNWFDNKDESTHKNARSLATHLVKIL